MVYSNISMFNTTRNSLCQLLFIMKLLFCCCTNVLMCMEVLWKTFASCLYLQRKKNRELSLWPALDLLDAETTERALYFFCVVEGAVIVAVVSAVTVAVHIASISTVTCADKFAVKCTVVSAVTVAVHIASISTVTCADKFAVKCTVI